LNPEGIVQWIGRGDIVKEASLSPRADLDKGLEEFCVNKYDREHHSVGPDDVGEVENGAGDSVLKEIEQLANRTSDVEGARGGARG
jgi:hypothetical protein